MSAVYGRVCSHPFTVLGINNLHLYIVYLSSHYDRNEYVPCPKNKPYQQYSHAKFSKSGANGIPVMGKQYLHWSEMTRL